VTNPADRLEGLSDGLGSPLRREPSFPRRSAGAQPLRAQGPSRLPPAARDGIARAWKAILEERHPGTTWTVYWPDER